MSMFIGTMRNNTYNTVVIVVRDVDTNDSTYYGKQCHISLDHFKYIYKKFRKDSYCHIE